MKSCGILSDFCRNLDKAEEELNGLCSFLGRLCRGRQEKKKPVCKQNFCENLSEKEPDFDCECETLKEKCEFCD